MSRGIIYLQRRARRQSHVDNHEGGVIETEISRNARTDSVQIVSVHSLYNNSGRGKVSRSSPKRHSIRFSSALPPSYGNRSVARLVKTSTSPSRVRHIVFRVRYIRLPHDEYIRGALLNYDPKRTSRTLRAPVVNIHTYTIRATTTTITLRRRNNT